MTQRPQNQQRPVAPKVAHPDEKDHRESNDQSGSTGRNPGTGDNRDGADSGQDRYGMNTTTNPNPPQPGHDTGSSGTSEYGRSDYDEPGDHERGSNEGSGRADRDESEVRQSQSQKSAVPAKSTEAPSKPRDR
jgi:hypothetical protein